MISAQIVLDSISSDGVRLTTMALRYPRFIHAELMTHRVFSRNAQSSRAVPVERLLEEVEANPGIPARFGVNQPGMQDGGEMTVFGQKAAKEDWLAARDAAVAIAKRMLARPERAHKQIINRILEPYTFITVLVSSTEWKNFYALRDHEDADPTMLVLARAVIAARDASVPSLREHGDWHLPFIEDVDIDAAVDLGKAKVANNEIKSLEAFDAFVTDTMCKVSVARCARISYLTHDQRRPTLDEDLALFSRLMTQRPLHASPAEHQAQPDRMVVDNKRLPSELVWESKHLHGNFTGWIQYRKTFVGEAVHDNADVLTRAKRKMFAA